MSGQVVGGDGAVAVGVDDCRAAVHFVVFVTGGVAVSVHGFIRRNAQLYSAHWRGGTIQSFRTV